MVKLSENNFLLWKHRIMLILERYGLQSYVLSPFNIPRFVIDTDGNLIENIDFLLHKQQDKLLASWLPYTGSDDVLAYLTNASSSFDVWMTIERSFTTRSSIKLSSLRHMLYSQKK